MPNAFVIRVTSKRQSAATNRRAYHYSLAGKAVVFEQAIPQLKAFEGGMASGVFSELLRNSPEPVKLTAANAQLLYHGTAPFADKQCEVRYWRLGHNGQVDIDGEPSCHINFSESHIHVINDQPIDSALNLELVTGPALVLLLALSHTYCLHAGAVTAGGFTFAIMAESGVGKSTLSRHRDDDWLQVADDVLPLHLLAAGAGVELRPSFPQLKLADAIVPAGVVLPRPLDYLLRLSAEPSRRVKFRRLGRRESTLQAIRHTVGAKLFDSSMLRKHLNFANTVSSLVRTIEVSYPRNLNQLDSLRSHIVERFERDQLDRKTSGE